MGLIQIAPAPSWHCRIRSIRVIQFHLGRLGSVIDPRHDVVPGSNSFYFCLNSGLAVVNSAGSGVGLCPLDSPCVSLGAPGLWRYARQRPEPKQANVFVNLFNNQWSTNFRFWNGGTWTARVRLWSVSKYTLESAIITPALETRQPLLAASCKGPAGDRPAVGAGLRLSRKGVVVTEFGPNPDGQGLVLRLWEQAGNHGPCTVTIPAGLAVTSAQPIDLRGAPCGTARRIQQHQLQVELQPYAPVSFRLAGKMHGWNK